jgi:hypothetical protein
MLSTIHLDNQLRLDASKISNVSAYWHLVSKAKITELSQPQKAFNFLLLRRYYRVD